MKHLASLLVLTFYLYTYHYSYSQDVIQHFDNKPFIEGEFLVQLRSEQALDELIKSAPIHFELGVSDYISPPMRIWLLKFNHHNVSHASLQEWLYHQSSVSAADYNYVVELRSTTPNDVNFNQQWHHVNTGQTGGTPDADIDSDLAWDITTGGKTATNDDVVVCLIESGNLDHVDISPNRWVNIHEIPGNGIDDDGNGYIDDYNGWNPLTNNDNYGTGAHGTNCLGMIGAKGDNGLNVVGANWDVKLMVVGGYSTNTQASIIAAYTYPLVMRKRWNASNGLEGAFVVATSASWGLDGANPASYPLWCSFYDTLGYHGIINIGATTNSNLNVDTAGDMPTACSSPYMVGVGRTDHNDNTAGGYGVSTIYFGAPGINVVTTAGTNGITTTTGTSFSCPLTAGVVGLAYSIPCPSFMNIVKSNPQLGADLVLEALINGVDVKSQLATRFITGGRLNAKNTLDLLMEATCSACNVSNIELQVVDQTVTISFDSGEEVNATTIQYRPVGTTTWLEINATGMSTTIDELEPCTQYELQILASCESESSTSAIATFQTKGCGNCVDLTYCEVSKPSNTPRLEIFEPTASTITNYVKTASWGADVDQGTYYGQMALMLGTGTPNEGCGTISNTGNLNGKIAVAVRGTCDFSTKAMNAQNAGAIALIIINNASAAPTSLGAGTNAASITIPVVLISQTQGSAILNALNNNQQVTALLGKQQEWIESFSLNGSTFNSGNNNGYLPANGTQSIALQQGESYPFTINHGYTAGQLPEATKIWLDINQNGTFEASELVYSSSTASNNNTSGTLEIPLTATLGSTRLRVQMAFQPIQSYTLPTVCGVIQYGETEDYCITVTQANEEEEPNIGLSTLLPNELVVYPNPAKNTVTFEWANGTEISSIELLDVLGRTIHSGSTTVNKHIINTEELSSGTYIYRIYSTLGVILTSGKISIQK